MASTNTALLFGFITFWAVLIAMVGLVSSDILVSSTDGDITSAVDDVQSEAGFFGTVFVWIADTLISSLGFESIGVVVLGFASLPEWLNALLFIPLVFFTTFALIVSLVPGTG